MSIYTYPLLTSGSENIHCATHSKGLYTYIYIFIYIYTTCSVVHGSSEADGCATPIAPDLGVLQVLNPTQRNP